MKTILIFGAGLNQLELIREAKNLGVISIAIDPNSNAVGVEEADFFYRVDGDDYELTKEIALKHNVNGIVTGQMENPLRLMARLAQELGFIFNSPEVVERCRDKHLMKECFIKNQIPCAKGVLFSGYTLPTQDELEKQNLVFPLIIKPTDAHSSRGVVRVEDYKELKEQVLETANFSSNQNYLVEEFLEGQELSVEAITHKGETHIVQFTEKFITPFPRTVELGHLQPARITSEEKEEIDKVVKKAIVALGIDNSPTHTEVMLTKKGVKIIEVAARLGGDFIGSYLTKASTGISLDRATIEIALGLEPKVEKENKEFAYIKYFFLPAQKKVVEVLNYQDILEEDSLVFAQIFVKPGDITTTLTHSAHRAGCVLVKGKTYRDVLQKAQHFENRLTDKIKLQ